MSNTLPSVAWAMMEIIRDPLLFAAVREEVLQAFSSSPKSSGEGGDAQPEPPMLDVKKLVSLPLLQSIYAEVLRLHVSINLTREVTGDAVTLGAFQVKRGSLLQAPTRVAHLDEPSWGVDGHPASEFWAERHIKYVERVD